MVRYAQANHLTDQRGWKWAKKLRVTNERVIRLIRRNNKAVKKAFVIKGKTKKQKYGPKYKFGVRVPRGPKQARAFDEENGNTLRGDAIKKEVTRKSVSGILMFANNTPVKWFCKRANTVETSTYGSELVSGRLATEMSMEMRYKLRMLGVPIDGEVTMYGDNMGVIQSTSVPSSVLKKKHNSIAWHRLREAVASGVVDLIHVRSEWNLSDALTKGLGPIVYERLVKPLFTRTGANDITYKGSDEQ